MYRYIILAFSVLLSACIDLGSSNHVEAPTVDRFPPITDEQLSNLRQMPFRFGRLSYFDGCSVLIPRPNQLDYILYDASTGSPATVESLTSFSEVRIFDVSRSDFILDRAPKLLSSNNQPWVQAMRLGTRRQDSVHTRLLAYDLDGEIIAAGKILSPNSPVIRHNVETISGNVFSRRTFQGIDYWYLPVNLTNMNSPRMVGSPYGGFWRNAGELTLSSLDDLSADPMNAAPPRLHLPTEAAIIFPANQNDEVEMEGLSIVISFEETNPMRCAWIRRAAQWPLGAAPLWPVFRRRDPALVFRQEAQSPLAARVAVAQRVLAQNAQGLHRTQCAPFVDQN